MSEAERLHQVLAVLRDAQERAKALEQRSYGDPEWGPWFRRADQRNIYEHACERAIEILQGG